MSPLMSAGALDALSGLQYSLFYFERMSPYGVAPVRTSKCGVAAQVLAHYELDGRRIDASTIPSPQACV